jgi:lysophospholipase L1-like esterase
MHFYGRWNQLDDRSTTVNSGSHITATFKGTAIAAGFDVTENQPGFPTLAWQIDGGDFQESEVAATVDLATDLSDGEHEILLMARGLDENQSRWTPPLVASLTFLGFVVTGGELIPSPRPERPKLEFLGDSITEGVLVHADQATASWNADGRLAYPCQTALKLDAEWRQVGFGRLGLTVTGNGGVPIANDSFDWIYEDVPRDDWQPDLVVINLGTNDWEASATDFASAYETYLTTVREAYPEAEIAAMRPFAGTHESDIQTAIQNRNDAGDAHVFYVDTLDWLAGEDFNGLHPNEQGGEKASTELAAVLEPYL